MTQARAQTRNQRLRYVAEMAHNDVDLHTKVELIEDLPFDESDAIYLLLMIAGKKRGSFLQLWSEPWREGDRALSYPEETRRTVENSLGMLGLAYEIRTRVTTDGLDQPYDGYGRKRYHELLDVYAAHSSKDVLDMIKAREDRDERALGTLLGYPATAIDAFVNETPLDEESVPLAVRLSPEWQFVAFRFSRAHWQEEFEYVKDWVKTIHELSPLLYDSYLRAFSVVHPWVYDQVIAVLKTTR